MKTGRGLGWLAKVLLSISATISGSHYAGPVCMAFFSCYTFVTMFRCSNTRHIQDGTNWKKQQHKSDKFSKGVSVGTIINFNLFNFS